MVGYGYQPASGNDNAISDPAQQRVVSIRNGDAIERFAQDVGRAIRAVFESDRVCPEVDGGRPAPLIERSGVIFQVTLVNSLLTPFPKEP